MLADRIQARLDALGISANKASVDAGLGRDYVRDILRNKVREPSADRLERLASVLRCDTAYLLEKQDEPGPAKNRFHVNASTLPISYRIRAGFHKDDDGSIRPIDWRVSPLTPTLVSEWLERVEDEGLQDYVPPWSILHVQGDMVINAISSGDLLVITESVAGTDLIRRTVRKAHHFGFGLIFDERLAAEEPENPITEAMFGSRDPQTGIKVEGLVLAVYRYYDTRALARMRG